MLSGARQVGKTTLLRQMISRLLESGVAPANILYATFDHPIIKLGGIEAVLRAWREREPAQPGAEYLFLDEAQYLPDWLTWVKHQTDFEPQRRIVFTGSAVPLLESGQESGVGRWHTIRLTTLSFFEYLRIRSKQGSSPAESQESQLDWESLPALRSLASLFEWQTVEFTRVADMAKLLTGEFHEYLLRGGFPQLARMDDLDEAQRLLREDIVDKVLKRDMTAFYGVRRVLELERLFIYFCLHDGAVLNLSEVSGELGLPRATLTNFLSLLESAHLIYRLPAFGLGKEVLRARQKVYLADPSIAPAVMLQNKSILSDSNFLGPAVENAVFKHLYARLYRQSIGFSYWRNKQDQEVDVIGQVGNLTVPFEVKYRLAHTKLADLQGLLTFCQERACPRGYVVTRAIDDFSILKPRDARIKLLKIPAPLLCYWMGQAELGDSQWL